MKKLWARVLRVQWIPFHALSLEKLSVARTCLFKWHSSNSVWTESRTWFMVLVAWCGAVVVVGGHKQLPRSKSKVNNAAIIWGGHKRPPRSWFWSKKNISGLAWLRPIYTWIHWLCLWYARYSPYRPFKCTSTNITTWYEKNMCGAPHEVTIWFP